MMRDTLISRRGTVLIMALWTLAFLGIFALTIGLHVRQKITVLSRLEKRSALALVAEAGVRKAKAVFDSLHLGRRMPFSGRHKQVWFNDPGSFRAVELGDGVFDVAYNEYPSDSDEPVRKYGLSDEERRLNVNTADRFILARLIALVSPPESGRANRLARAIVSWREYGDTDIVGFYSDAFYENLEYPYPSKKAPFENLEELKLVEGITDAVYGRLIDFITVYGEGKVNINTASAPVLAALGLSSQTVERLLSLRQGPDGRDDTVDDYMFRINRREQRVVLPEDLDLDDDQIALLHQLVQQGVLGAVSSYYRIESTGRLNHSQEMMTVLCVFQGENGKIDYWQERRSRPETLSPGG